MLGYWMHANGYDHMSALLVKIKLILIHGPKW